MSNRFPKRATTHRMKVESLTAATKALTDVDSGTLFLLNKADGIAVTLPAITGADAGLFYEFQVDTAVSGGTVTITAQSGDLLDGWVENVDTDTSNAHAYYSPDGSDDLIFTMNGTTQGGRVASWCRFVATPGGKWFVTGQMNASGTVATPFS